MVTEGVTPKCGGLRKPYPDPLKDKTEGRVYEDARDDGLIQGGEMSDQDEWDDLSDSLTDSDE